MLRTCSKQVVRSFFVSVGELTRFNVLVEYLHKVVSVRADLLVVESQSVENFVLYGVGVQAAVGLQGHGLSLSLAAQVGPTPGTENTQRHKGLQYFIKPLQRVRASASPPGAPTQILSRSRGSGVGSASRRSECRCFGGRTAGR